MDKTTLFVDNLTEDAVNSHVRRPALLLSALTSNKKLAKYALQYAESEGTLVIDNGNAKIIIDTSRTYKSEAAKACKSKDTDELKRLAYTVCGHCTAECNDEDYFKQVLAKQMELHPTYFMCGENLTAQVLVELDMDRELLELDDDFYVDTQRYAIKRIKNIMGGKYGKFTGEPFAVLHGIDYDTAYKVGRLAAQSKAIKNIATGLAGFMNDLQTTDRYRFRGKWLPFNYRKAIYRKFFQTVAVSLGLIHGFRSVSGVAPQFHGLGIGSPFAILLLAYALRECDFFALDSSAPSKNASMGKLYVSEPAYLTLPVENIAAGICGKGKIWDCPCPHCTAFFEKYPIDYEKAKDIFNSKPGEKVCKFDDLKNDTPLGQALLFFSQPKDPKLFKEIKEARAGHNYWVLDNMMAQINKLKDDKDAFDAWFSLEKERYMENASKIYAESIPEIVDFMKMAEATRWKLWRNSPKK